MKRSPLKRRVGLARSPLHRATPLRSRPKRSAPDPARDIWNLPQSGLCQCGCYRPSWRLHRHHVLLRQRVERAGGAVWDLTNSMLLHPECHDAHHASGSPRKLKLKRVPEAAIAFAVDLLGEASAVDYFRRRYDCGEVAV